MPTFAQPGGGGGVTPGARPFSGGGPITNPILAPVGCTTIPYSFVGRTTDGLCSIAANQVDIYLNGASAGHFTTTTFSVVGDIAAASGGEVRGAFLKITNDANYLYWNTRNRLTAPADGRFGFLIAAGTTGVVLDVNTDATAAFITRAGTDAATVSANFLKASGALQGPGTVATTGAVRLAHGGQIYGRNNVNGADYRLVDFGNVATDAITIGDASTTARLRTSMAVPGTLSNGDWWLTSDTGAVTGAHGILQARLNGATVTLGGDVATTTATPADQTGNATATFKMNGLGSAGTPCVITPVITGRVLFMISGDIAQNTTADGVTFKIAYGTGAAPANAAAATGTVIGAVRTWTALTGMLQVPASIQATATGLTLATAVWYDLQIADVTGGTASIKNVTCTAREY